MQSVSFRRVLATLSGGPDSVLLTYLLKLYGFEIIALHCNFHLRGDESNRDALIVEEFCKSNNISLIVKDFDIKKYKRENKGESLEMACRKVRYEWFQEIKEREGFDRISTGHNADDNIETLFLNLLRGSGTRGLKGMEYDNGEIWRPLLSLHRDDVIDLISEFNLDYITDSTNLESDFKRNFLRNEIFPLIKTKWSGFNTAIDSAISNLRAENKVVESVINKILKECGDKLSKDIILNFEAPLLLIRRFIDDMQPFSTTPSEILEALKASKPHIRRWRLRMGEVMLRNSVIYKQRDDQPLK